MVFILLWQSLSQENDWLCHRRTRSEALLTHHFFWQPSTSALRDFVQPCPVAAQAPWAVERHWSWCSVFLAVQRKNCPAKGIVSGVDPDTVISEFTEQSARALVIWGFGRKLYTQKFIDKKGDLWYQTKVRPNQRLGGPGIFMAKHSFEFKRDMFRVLDGKVEIQYLSKNMDLKFWYTATQIVNTYNAFGDEKD